MFCCNNTADYNQMSLSYHQISFIIIAVILSLTSSHLQTHSNLSDEPYFQQLQNPEVTTKNIITQKKSEKIEPPKTEEQLGKQRVDPSSFEILLPQQTKQIKIPTIPMKMSKRLLQQFQLTDITSISTPTSQNNLSTQPLQLTSSTLQPQLTPVRQVINKNRANPYIPSNSPNLKFASLVLYQQIPSDFLQNQIYSFRGSLLISNPGGTMVSVVFTRVNDGFKMVFSKELQPNESVFDISTRLNTPGSYYLAVFPGLSGRSLQTIFTVHPPFQPVITMDPPQTPKSAKLALKGNDLWIMWQNADQQIPCITKLVFKQGIQAQVFYQLSNFQTAFQIPYADFYDFKEGTVNIQISQAYSNSESAYAKTSEFSFAFNLSFNAVNHHFARFDSTSELNTIPLKIDVGGSFVISGISKTLLSNEVFLMTPNKTFISYFIIPNAPSNIVPINTAINIAITLDLKGIYLLQINNAGGSAIYNAPIYCGDIYPLLPDFMDLSPKDNNLTALSYPTSLKDRQLLVLQLINKVRKSYNVSSVYLDDTLSIFAQNYSQTQALYNYISHVDHQGKGLVERLAAFNINYGVSENLALDMNLTEAELMLQRSAAHLKNTVNPAWTRVGLGIAQNSAGYYYLTQEFSFRDMIAYPLTFQELNAIKTQVFSLIQTAYPIIISENLDLSTKLLSYQLQTDLISFLKSQGAKGSLLAFKITVTYDGSSYLKLIKGQLNFNLNSSFRRVALSLIYNGGFLYVIGVFTA